MKIFIRVGGVYFILCGILHIVMPAQFGWEGIFSKLQISPVELSYIKDSLYIMNYVLTFFWFIFGTIWLIYPGEIIQKGIGRILLVSMILFWLFRIFVLQTVYIGYDSVISFQMAGFFTVGLILSLIPFIASLKKTTS